MASIDEIIKAFGAFNEGLTQSATLRGIQEAKAQVDSINSQQLDFLTKRTQQEAVAKNLAMQLQSVGAPQSQVQGAYSAVAPQAFTPDLAYQEGMKTGDKDLITFAEKARRFEMLNQREMNDADNAARYEQLKLQRDLRKDALKAREEDKDQNLIDSRVKLFNQDDYKKKYLDGIEMAKTAMESLSSDNAVADAAAINQLVKASGDTGVITEADRQVFARGDWFNVLKKITSQATTGKLDDETRANLLKLSQLYQRRSGEKLKGVVDQYASQLARRTGRPMDELRKDFYDFDLLQPSLAQPKIPPGFPEGTKIHPKKAAGGKTAYILPNGKLVVEE